MSTFHFVYPQAFWLLLIIPIAIAGYIWGRKRKHATMLLSGFPFLPTHSWWHTASLHLPFVLECLAIAAMVVVLARPQNRNSVDKRTAEGIDLVLILDTSGSMEAIDLEPNRFEAARAVAQEFIAARPNDNIGLVAFAGESFTQCPTTTDHATLLELLGQLQTRIMEDGTAIGLGIANGINALKTGSAKSKVMILLTDGSNNAGSITPTMGAGMAQALGIRVYTVAVGTMGKALFPVETPIGTRYIEEEVTIDEPTLKNIANITGGKYFRATDNQSLKKIYQEIDQLEKTKLMSKNFTAYEELFPPYAWAALLLLILSYLLRSTLIRTNP